MPEYIIDGEPREMSVDEFTAYLRTLPEPDPVEMTEGQRYLANKMQEEALTSAALAAAGIESLDDLRVEGDDEPGEALPFDHPVPQEYDYEGALADLLAREHAATDAGGA